MRKNDVEVKRLCIMKSAIIRLCLSNPFKINNHEGKI